MKQTFIFILILFVQQLISHAQNLPQLGKDSIDEVVASMTLEDKVNIVVGAKEGNVQLATDIGMTKKIVEGAAGTTYPIPRLGITPLVLADGPAGLRISPTRKGTTATYFCTHFPVATLIASTWNKELVYEVGEAMGSETLQYGVDILLAPGVNIHRNPLCGRNFEYYSEDPVLAGKIAAAMINGIESKGVGTSLKHFAANNQETNRAANDAVMSVRALREIYLKPFEIAVKESQPWTVMTSYNRLNGVYTAERPDLSITVLRDEWGFEGAVVTDWYGGKNVINQIQAGNDLQMPGSNRQRNSLMQAVQQGELSLRALDEAVKNVLQLVLLSPRFKGYTPDNAPDLKKHAAITRASAAEGMVLLKNQKHALPLNRSVNKAAVFGVTSYDFIAGGTGSGNVNRAYTVSLTQGLENVGLKIDPSLQQQYEQYIVDEKPKLPKKLHSWHPDERIPEMLIREKEMEKLASQHDVAIITIGRISGEVMDRKLHGDFNLTDNEQQLIDDVCRHFQKRNKKVIVILNISGVIELASWIHKPDAVLLAWMAGQEGGNSVADILKGHVNPSGKLPVTFPVQYSDVPSAPNFPLRDTISKEIIQRGLSVNNDGSNNNIRNVGYTLYEEDIYVGYRYYDTFNKRTAFPFGFGLSYTTFSYRNMDVVKDGDDFRVSCEITNTGRYAGKEVTQLYVSAPGITMNKPVRELKAFEKTSLLKPGDKEIISFIVPHDYLAAFNEKKSAWEIEDGIYTFAIGASSVDLRLMKEVLIDTFKIIRVNPVLVPQREMNTTSKISQ
ncbi:MAG: glycoside hydrolase family 3 C-terminal domain-containing protein [Paludibacter sp.]|nr:glycoside hydrolase family 3 C-terminal domain-containing protein [Paludibacter sp.]